MLHPLQVSATAVQQHQEQPQQSLFNLPTGSTVYARLSLTGLYERAELLSMQPGQSRALVALHSTGTQHQVAADELVRSITIPQHEAQSDSSADIDSEASSSGGSQDTEDADEELHMRGRVASAVWDADEAAVQVYSL